MVTTHTQKGPKMANTYYVVTMTDGTMWRCCAANPESAKAKADRAQAEHGKDRTAVAQIVQDAAQFDAVQGFSFIRLDKKVDATALLRMARDELLDTVIGSHFDANRRRGNQLIRLDGDYRYLIARNSDDEGFFLVWDGPDENTDLTERVYETCAREAESAGLKASPYHVYARLYRYQTSGVIFYQIPDRILADFGLDMRNEPFTEVDE